MKMCSSLELVLVPRLPLTEARVVLTNHGARAAHAIEAKVVPVEEASGW
jgi:hypothetical protein